MKLRWSLPVKIGVLAFLNLILLALVFGVFARVQYRLDLSSFFLAPTRDRMLSVSRLIALQLPNAPPSEWTQVLAQYSVSYPARFYLFESSGQQLAGETVQLPAAIADDVRHDRFGPRQPGAQRRHDEHPPGPGGPQGPPLVLTRGVSPSEYWVAIHVPIWTSSTEPIHSTLVWRFASLWTNSFFFDFKPWLAVVFAVIGVSIICWLPLIRDLTRSISAIEAATGQIAEGHFDVQLPVKRRDELGQLSESIRSMAQRLSGYVRGQRRFLGDIAHELCSPVARMQAALGVLEQRTANTDAAGYVADVEEELQHMSALINELLSFSRSQIAAAETKLSAVGVNEVVGKVLEREGTAGKTVQASIDSTVSVVATPDYLFRSVANLVRNAIRYAGDGGPITVSARASGTSVAIVVADNGPGLPESELEQVFRPFYRPELARQRETGGVGLGLAIVKSCIEACGGTVECRNRKPHGFEVEIRLRNGAECASNGVRTPPGETP